MARAFEFEARDISTALALADNQKLVEAEVWENGVRKFLVRRDDDASQLWMIAGVQRQDQA
jgi:hypothetical protein